MGGWLDKIIESTCQRVDTFAFADKHPYSISKYVLVFIK